MGFLVRANSLQVIKMEISDTLPINHLTEVCFVTILQRFWYLAGAVLVFRGVCWYPLAELWLSRCTEGSWHRLGASRHPNTSLLYRQTLAGFTASVDFWWFLGLFFFNIREIFQLAGCKLVLKSIIKRNNPERSWASEIFGNVLLYACHGNWGTGDVSSIPDQLQICFRFCPVLWGSMIQSLKEKFWGCGHRMTNCKASAKPKPQNLHLVLCAVVHLWRSWHFDLS